MSYALVIPKHLVREMYFIREETGVSIRKQIIQAIEAHIDDKDKQAMSCDNNPLVFKKVDDRTYRTFNERTGRFHNLELGIDMMYLDDVNQKLNPHIK